MGATPISGPGTTPKASVDGTEIIPVGGLGKPTITVDQIASFLASSGHWIGCDDFTASEDAYPSTGGTFTAGAPGKWNTFKSSTGAIYNGNFVPGPIVFVALIDNPGQTSTNWLRLGSV